MNMIVAPSRFQSNNDAVLLLHMDGTNGSTTFTDSSPNALTVTAHGAAQISTAWSQFGGASGSFAGNFGAATGQSALTVPHSGLFDFAAGDFTIEGFLRLDALTGISNISHGLVCKRATTAVFAPFNIEAALSGGPTRLKGQVSVSGSSWITCQSTTNLAISTPYHWALCRSGTDLRLFLDGIQQDTTKTVSGALMTNTDGVSIGAASMARDYGLDGNLDEVRFDDFAWYTANFTPPAAPF